MEGKKTLKNNTFANEIRRNRNNFLTGKQYLLIIPLTKFYCCKENIDKLNNILDGNSKLSLRLIDWFVTNYSKKQIIMYNPKKFKNKINNFKNKNKNNILDNINKTQNKVTKIETKKHNNVSNNNQLPFSKNTLKKVNNNTNKKNICIFEKNNKNKLFKKQIINDSDSDSDNDNDNTDNDNVDSGLGEEEYFSDYFEVFSNYKAQLKSLNKKNFDPFCRRKRIKFYYNDSDNEYINTTVGQLNFFKWAIENYILEYIEENIIEIEYDMNKYTKNNNKKYIDKTKKKKKELKENKKNDTTKNDTTPQKTTRRKRKELSSSINKSFVIHNIKTVLDFN